MTLENIFNILEQILKRIDNRDSKIEAIKDSFDSALGISSEQHEVVTALLDRLEDSNDSLEEYQKQIDGTNDELKDLQESINKLKKDMSDPTISKAKKAEKREQLKKAKDREKDLRDEAKQLEMGRKNELMQNAKYNKKLGRNNVKDAKKALQEKEKMDKNMFALGKKKMAGLKYNIYYMAAKYIIKAIEFVIDKAAEYTKLHGENLIRAMNATTTATVNMMKAGMDSWKDSMNGAYSAQQLSVETTLAVMDAVNETNLANLKMQNTWTNWIPILGSFNKAKEVEMEMQNKIMHAETENAQKRIAQVAEYTKQTDEYIRKQNTSLKQYQTLNGLTNEQMQGFEKRMLSNGTAFAKFNKTIEDVLKLQSSFTEQSGRGVNFSDSDYMKTLGVGRLVGEDKLTQFSAMMNIFNSSISSSADIMYDMYNYANTMGLSQQKLTKNVLSNLKLANKYDFRNGTKGFIELAKWAENARMNLSSFGSVIEKIQAGGLEEVIKQGAGLQVLGGNIAMGADPLAMMFEGGADQQSLAKRILSMTKGYGSFNKATGETTFSWNENMILRNMAQQLGMSVEDVKDITRGARQKEYVRAQMRGSTLSKENKDAIANKAQYDQKSKKWYVNTINGQRIDVGDVTENDMSRIVSNNKEENAEKYAQSTLSAVEKIEGTTKYISALLGGDEKSYSNFMKNVEKSNQQTVDAYNNNKDELVNTISRYRDDSVETQQETLNAFNGIYEQYMLDQNSVKDYREQMKQKLEELKRELEEINKEKRETHKKTQAAEYTANKAWGDTKWYNPIGMAKALHYSGEANFAKADEEWANGRYGSSMWENVKGYYKTYYGNPYSYAKAIKDLFTPVSKSVKMNDGIITNNGLVQSDPKDVGIFAKEGGPIGKFLNDLSTDVHTVLGNGGKMNIELSGKLELSSGGQTINILEEMKKNPLFVRNLTQLLAENLSQSKNGGRGKSITSRVV